MAFLRRAKNLLRGQGSSQVEDETPVDDGTRSAYWKGDFRRDVPVTKNFYHEIGQHGWGNNEAQNYVDSPANCFHGQHTTPDGTTTDALVLRAIIDNSHRDKSKAYTSARLSSHVPLARPRGSLSARITAPVAPGIWPAFWLLPQDPFVWPTDGEVDIMESWNGDPDNHSCLHWGHYDARDWNKHRVVKSRTPHLGAAQGVLFTFTWTENPSTGEGKLLWSLDGRPVMRASKPAGTRPMADFRILLNIAVGGTLNKGTLPADGSYEMAVRELEMWDAPLGGWAGFEREWKRAPEGKPNS
ncbi:hypothetical protein NCC49_005423 [Naganishia albida]|nr:hypothetical protein NCC49_005423 [Naganishia albida]